MAAGATLVGGAGFSITHGFHAITHGEDLSDLRLSFVVLAVSFVIEAISWAKAMSQVRKEAERRGISPQAFVLRTSDTALKAVLFEDTAALTGLVIAALGLLGARLTGDPVWDGVASVLIGVLLLAIALKLIVDNASLSRSPVTRWTRGYASSSPESSRSSWIRRLLMSGGNARGRPQVQGSSRRSA